MTTPTLADLHARLDDILGRTFFASWLPAAMRTWDARTRIAAATALLGIDGDGIGAPGSCPDLNAVVDRVLGIRVVAADSAPIPAIPRDDAAFQRLAAHLGDRIADTLTNHPALDGWMAMGIGCMAKSARVALLHRILPAFHVDAQAIPVVPHLEECIMASMDIHGRLPATTRETMAAQAARVTAEDLWASMQEV
jgi:hypothetical protein